MTSSPSLPTASSSPAVAPLPARGDLPTDVDAATGVVLIQSEDLPASTPIVRGPQFDSASPLTLDALLSSFLTTGFQATNLGLAVEEINRMIRWRLSDEPLPEGETEAEQPVDRRSVRCTIFLAFTSNMISSGVREVVRYLVKHRMVDALITTCGGVEEDILKCLHPHYVGSFSLDGAALRRKGQNRIGNLLVEAQQELRRVRVVPHAPAGRDGPQADRAARQGSSSRPPPSAASSGCGSRTTPPSCTGRRATAFLCFVQRLQMAASAT